MDGARAATDVAIVGAGPVGLVLAGELAARGVDVMVLEREASRSMVPKANGVVGHSAVELAKRGIISGTGLRVISPSRFQFGPLELQLGSGRENPLHIVAVPQHRLEELSERHALAQGARVHRSQEVLAFSQSDDVVEVEVSSGGLRSHVAARYLVGCDGARSSVRKLAAIGFPGLTSDEIAHIARVTIPATRLNRFGAGTDVEIEGVGRFAMMRRNQLPSGGFSIAPVSALDPTASSDLYLISTHEPRGHAEASDTVSIDELRASLRRVLGADLPFTDATAVRSTVSNSRQAATYRHGRVLLAGDAAHIFNAGGSALNVGLQDAFDLAPRLEAALASNAPPADLDQYERARRPSVDRVLWHTRTQAALGRGDETATALRETMKTLLQDPNTARQLAKLIEAP